MIQANSVIQTLLKIAFHKQRLGNKMTMLFMILGYFKKIQYVRYYFTVSLD